PRGKGKEQRSLLSREGNTGARNRTTEGEFDVVSARKPSRWKRRMRLSPAIQAARPCDPLAPASRARPVHAAGVGGSLPRHEHACAKAGTSQRGGHLCEGRFPANSAATR